MTAKHLPTDPRIVTLYRQGMSMRNIARQLRLPLVGVKRAIIHARFGIPTMSAKLNAPCDQTLKLNSP